MNEPVRIEIRAACASREDVPPEVHVDWNVDCVIVVGATTSSGSELVDAPAGASHDDLRKLLLARYGG